MNLLKKSLSVLAVAAMAVVVQVAQAKVQKVAKKYFALVNLIQKLV